VSFRPIIRQSLTAITANSGGYFRASSSLLPGALVNLGRFLLHLTGGVVRGLITTPFQRPSPAKVALLVVAPPALGPPLSCIHAVLASLAPLATIYGGSPHLLGCFSGFWPVLSCWLLVPVSLPSHLSPPPSACASHYFPTSSHHPPAPDPFLAFSRLRPIPVLLFASCRHRSFTRGRGASRSRVAHLARARRRSCSSDLLARDSISRLATSSCSSPPLRPRL
jgi:hypothetical protein